MAEAPDGSLPAGDFSGVPFPGGKAGIQLVCAQDENPLGDLQYQNGAHLHTGRICINLNLGHLPPEYLSYIVIHELTHLWEKGHGEQFKARMDQYYPQWRERRQDIIKLAYML